jgi:hypothetical protein
MIDHRAFLAAQRIKNKILKKIRADEQMRKTAGLQNARQRIG